MFFLIFEFLTLSQKMTSVLSSKHESQVVTIIGTLLDDNHVGCKYESFASFSQCVSRTF